MLELQQEINKDSLTSFIQNRLDKRFENLKSDRTKIESEWVDKIAAATSGSAPSPLKNSLVKLYTNLKDMTLPSLVRKLHSRETAWLDTDFFRWTPDGVESTDIEGAYWLTDYQQDNLNNELSQFHNVIRAAIWQREVLNISALNYVWSVIPKHEYNYEIDQQSLDNGFIQAQQYVKKQSPFEYELQGIKFEFISMLNLYPDVIQTTTYENLNLLDLYYSVYKTYNEVQNFPLFNPQNPYAFKTNVLYQSTEGLEQLKDTSVSYSQAQLRINSSLSENSKDTYNDVSKQMIEIRTAILKEIRLDGMKESMNGEGRGYRLMYAKSGSTYVPLFLETNPYPFEKKSIRLSRRLIDPYNLYNDSEIGLAINQHYYIVNQRQLQGTALANSTSPNRLWSTAIIDALEGSKDEFNKMLTETGHNKFINHQKLGELTRTTGIDPTKPISLGSTEEQIRTIQLLEEAINKAKMDIQQINTQVTQESGAGATAQYNKQVAQELDLVSKEAKQSICNDWLKPALIFGFEMAKTVFQDQKFTTDITEDDKKSLIGMAGDEELEFEDIKNYSQETGMTLQKPARVGNQQIPVQYNPVTEKKQMILSRTLFQNTQCGLKLEFEESEYSKQFELEELVQLASNLMANVPDSPLKFLFMKDSILQALQFMKMPNYDKLAEKAEELFEQMINPPPPQPDPVQEQALVLEGQKKQADIEKTQSETQKNYAEVENKKFDNVSKALTGV